MLAEAFHSTIKGIHLALEVKTSFGNSVPARGSSMESSTTNKFSTDRIKVMYVTP
jgi:hypothetical protein